MGVLVETTAREVRDVYGRRRRVGESAEALLGHARGWQLVAACAGMVAISPLQYAFGLTAVRLQEVHGWSTSRVMWLLALFIVCQAAVAVPAAWLTARRRVRAGHAVLVGGVLAAVGLLALGHTTSWLMAALGFSLCGGVGAGLVYAQSVATAGAWFPDRRPAALGVVSGGFAVGAVATIALLTVLPSAHALDVATDVAALAATVVALAAGLELRDPPRGWWPAHVDPQLWAVDRRLNRGIPSNMPAVRYYSPAEALRTGTLPLMWAMLAISSAVSLVGIAFVAGYAVSASLGLGLAGLGTGLVAAVNGLGRAAASRLSDRHGRRRVLTTVLTVEGMAQLGLWMVAPSGGAAAFLLCATLIGLGGGASYTIFGHLVHDYFGEQSLAQNHAVLYTAKAVGAVVGVGLGAVVVAGLGYRPVFLVAGLGGLATAWAVRLLRQPGRPSPRR